MGITAPLGTPFFEGFTTSQSVPFMLPVALGGHPYLIDLTQYRRSTVPALRQAQDTGREVGENSLSSEGLWNRSAADFSLGAGQEFFDNEDSLRRRYRRSIGVDPWERDKICLLPDTERKLVSAATNLRLLSASNRLYVLDGQSVRYTTDPTPASPTWTTVTGTPAATALDFTSDGFDVYVAYGASDLYRIAGGGSSAAALGTTDTDVVGYTNGRLLAGHDNVVSEVDSAGAYTALFTHPLAGFKIRGFTSSPSNAYFFGDTDPGGSSAIYRFGVQENGTLSAAIFSGDVPLGETINEMAYYAGIVLITTTRGVRVANVAGDGSLVVGPLVEVDGGSECVVAEGRYSWFGWSQPYGELSAGLGRADLGAVEFPNGSPPYASDVLASGETAAITGVASFGGRRYFAVSGDGFWGATANRVASGWVESGKIRYGTLERKVGVEVTFGHDPLAGEVDVEVRDDSSDFLLVGSNDAALSIRPLNEFPITSRSGEWLEVRLTLQRSATDATDGPCVRRWTLRALPSPSRIDEIIVPIVFRSKIRSPQGAGAYIHQSLMTEFDFLRSLERDGRIISYQEGERTDQVYVDRVQMAANGDTSLEWSDDRSIIEGTLLIRLLTV